MGSPHSRSILPSDRVIPRIFQKGKEKNYTSFRAFLYNKQIAVAIVQKEVENNMKGGVFSTLKRQYF